MGTPPRRARTTGRDPRRMKKPTPSESASEVSDAQRIILRSPTARDRAEFLALKRRNRAFLKPWEATPVGGPSPFAPSAFDRFMKSARTESSQRFLICRASDGAIVGQIGLGGIIRGAFQSCFVGYWIAKEFTRRGYMREALSLAIEFAFRELKLHRVEANIIPRNQASKALVKSLGFRCEGTARRYLRIDGRWQDHEHWAMTVEEWRLLTNTPAHSPPSI